MPRRCPLESRSVVCDSSVVSCASETPSCGRRRRSVRRHWSDQETFLTSNRVVTAAVLCGAHQKDLIAIERRHYSDELYGIAGFYGDGVRAGKASSYVRIHRAF